MLKNESFVICKSKHANQNWGVPWTWGRKKLSGNADDQLVTSFTWIWISGSEKQVILLSTLQQSEFCCFCISCPQHPESGNSLPFLKALRNSIFHVAFPSFSKQFFSQRKQRFPKLITFCLWRKEFDEKSLPFLQKSWPFVYEQKECLRIYYLFCKSHYLLFANKGNCLRSHYLF